MPSTLDFDLGNLVTTYLIPLGWKLAGAILLWIVGGWVINVVGNLSNRGMTRQKVEPTLIRYIEATLRVIMRIVLVIVILSVFGIETTSFAALLAAAGIAIGAAWSGLLANFAAGAFLIILRPFKVGDFISAGGMVGTVKELGLFATTILTPDNVMTVVGNNKVFGDNIQNFSAEPFRRVDCVAKVANSVDVQDAIARLRPAIAAIANVKDSPAPDIEILQFTPEGPLLCVRPYTHTDHYWQVYFDTHKAIVNTFGAAGYPVPETPVAHRTVSA